MQSKCCSVFQCVECVVMCYIVNTSRAAGTSFDQISLRGSIQCVCCVCCSVFQCVTVVTMFCCLLPCVAVCCSVLQRTTVFCSALNCQHKPWTSNSFWSDCSGRLNIFCVRVTVCYSELQYVAVCVQCVAMCCNVLQRVTVWRSVLQCVPACCSVL